jgi:hypothetical protein
LRQFRIIDEDTNALSICLEGKAIMTFYANGRVKIDPSLQPVEAAAAALKAMEPLFEGMSGWKK